MDLLRGAAVLLIVVWHVFSVGPLFGGVEVQGWARELNDALSPFRIPALLVLSGMLLEHSLTKGRVRYIVGKLRHIAWPYLLWCLLIAAVGPSFPALMSPWFWLGGNILWFLAVLLFCYAAALIRPNWLPWWVCVVVPLALLWIFDPTTNAFVRFLWFGSFFFLGTSLRKSLSVIQGRLPNWGAAALAASALAGGLAVARGLIQAQTPLFFIVSALGIVAVLWAAPRVPTSRVTQVLEWYGRNSIIVYVGHAFAMFGAMRVIVLFGAESSMWVITLLALVGFGMPTLAILVRPRIEGLFVFPRLSRVGSMGRSPAVGV